MIFYSVVVNEQQWSSLTLCYDDALLEEVIKFAAEKNRKEGMIWASSC